MWICVVHVRVVFLVFPHGTIMYQSECIRTPRRALTFLREQPSLFTNLFFIPEVSFHAEQRYRHLLLMYLEETENIVSAHHRGRRQKKENIHMPPHVKLCFPVVSAEVFTTLAAVGRGPTCMLTRPQVGIGSRGLRWGVGVRSSEFLRLRHRLSYLQPCRRDASLRVLFQVSGLGHCTEIVPLIP